ncbi:hypothetical protein VTK56DRAFT_1855 [Thermocarpiscus australiensis]
MLGNAPALPSPQRELCASSHSVPATALRASSVQGAITRTDNGSPSKRQTPASPFQPGHKHQHGLDAPRPPLSPLSEYHSGFTDEHLGSPYSPANHRRQQSFPNLLPLAFRNRTPSPTRKTHARHPSDQMPYTGDGRSNGRAAADSPRSGGGLVSWLTGREGAASALGMSMHAEARSSPNGNGASKGATPNGTPTKLRRSTTSTTAEPAPTPKSTMTTTASRFMSAISSRFNPTTPTSPGLDDDDDDDLRNLNIEAALFPHGPPPSSSDRDDHNPFSPAAFKNLHANAVGLLARMQAAYREQAAVLRALRAERAAQRDELDEAETRARHLKMQLEGMARRAQEHERAIASLVEELAVATAEKGRRVAGGRRDDQHQHQHQRQHLPAAAAAAAASAAPASLSEGASMVSEDLGVDEDRRRRRRRRRRRSGTESWKSSGGGGDDSDDDDEEDEEDENESAESESVFSRCRSPALPPPPEHAPAHAATDRPGTTQLSNPAGGGGGSLVSAPLKQKSGQQMSAFQKIIRGIAGDLGEDAGANGCANCRGQDASVAWNTVSLLRDENKHLKRRVGELEAAVEAALDLVNGIGL